MHKDLKLEFLRHSCAHKAGKIGYFYSYSLIYFCTNDLFMQKFLNFLYTFYLQELLILLNIESLVRMSRKLGNFVVY